MALTPVAVCNQALALLGQAPITDLAGGDVHSRLCAAIYETVRDELLGVREWAFATKWHSCTPLSAAPGNPRYATQYQRPAGVLRVLEACSAAGETDLDWTPEADRILTAALSGSGTAGSPTLSGILGVGSMADDFVWDLSGSLVNISDALVSFHLAPDMDGDFDVGRIYIEVNGEHLLTRKLTSPYDLGAPWASAMALEGMDTAGEPEILQGLTLQLLDCPSDPPIPDGLEYGAIWRFEIGSPRTPGTGNLLIRTLDQITDPADWPAYFTAAVVARIAYELAVPVTENMQALAAMERRAAAKLREAAAVDGMQGRSSVRRSTSLADKRRS